MTPRQSVVILLVIFTVKDACSFELPSWLRFNVTDIWPNFIQTEAQLSPDQPSSEAPTPKQIETSTFQMSPTFYSHNEISSSIKNGMYELTWSPSKPIEMSDFEALRNRRRRKTTTTTTTTPSPSRQIETALVETSLNEVAKNDISKAEPERQVDSITYTPLAFLAGAIAIIAAFVVISYIIYQVDSYATERLDEFLLDYYGPHMYDRYTTRFDTYPMERPRPLGLKATTAKDYYGLKRSFNSVSLGTKVLSLLSAAEDLYKQN